MIVNTNIASLNAQRSLLGTNNAMQKSLEKLSSGYRINKAADDAAGLAISEKMRGQIRGLNQAIRNAQSAISLIQTAEGALNETHSILQRMRELAVQAANDTNTASDREKIQAEVDQLAKELTRIANTTEFNTQKLLNGGIIEGNIGKINFQIGANQGQSIDLAINAMDAFSLGVAGSKATGSVTNDGTTGDVLAGATISIARDVGTGIVDGASISVTAADIAATAGTTGAVDIDGAGGGTGTIEIATTTNTPDLNGYTFKFTDNDGTLGTSVDTNNKVITISGDFDGSAVTAPTDTDIEDSINTALTAAGFTAQIGITLNSATVADLTNADPAGFTLDGGSDGSLTRITLGGSQTIDVKDTDTSFTVTSGTYKGLTVELASGRQISDLTANGTATIGITVEGSSAAQFNSGILTAEATAGAGINVSSQSAANSAITIIDNAINQVSEERSKLGAYQNRLEHTINNLGTASENLTASESRIRDVDMAAEMSAFTKSQILSQAGVAMLAQANQVPQAVLKLLG